MLLLRHKIDLLVVKLDFFCLPVDSDHVVHLFHKDPNARITESSKGSECLLLKLEGILTYPFSAALKKLIHGAFVHDRYVPDRPAYRLACRSDPF